MKKTLLVTSLALALTTTPALADELYLDGGIGISDAEVGRFETDDIYFRIGAGVNLLDNVSVEGGFWDLGSDRDNGFEVSVDALYGAVKAQTDIATNLKLYGRVGLLAWDADVGSGDDDGIDLFFGAGVGFQAGPGMVNFEIHFTELESVDVQTFGISYTLPISF